MHKKYVFFIDKTKFETEEDQLSVKQILVDFGGYDPVKSVLVLKDGHELIEKKDLDEMLDLKNGLHFTIYSTEPNLVS